MLEKGRDNVTDIHTEVRNHLTPSSETRRRVDACETVTKDVVEIAYVRMAAVDSDYDSETVRQRPCNCLKETMFTPSMYPQSRLLVDTPVIIPANYRFHHSS